MSDRCKVTKRKKDSTFGVQFKCLTEGEVLSLINALRIGRTVSPVAADLSAYLRNGFHAMEGDLDTAQKFMDTINEDIGLKVVKDDDCT